MTPSTESPAESLDVSVVLPCLDEAETVEIVVSRALSAIERMGRSGEVIVADNGSTDGSQALAEAAGARVVHIDRRGYGAALQGGIEASRGTYVLMADADDSYDLDGIAPFVAALDDGADLVMGNRFAGGVEPGAMPWLHRYVGNPVLSFVGRLFFGSKIRDFHCGLRGFRRDAILGLDLRTTGMEFASEMVVRATLSNLEIAEVPTILRPDGRTRTPHLRTWRDGWRHIRFLLLYSPRWLFIYPGLVLSLLGLIGTLALLPGPLDVGSVTFDIHALLYTLTAIIIGIQAVFFGVFARVYAASAGLIPETDRVRTLLRWGRLEIGILLGSILVVAGLVGSVVAVGRWGDTSFGGLDASDTMRLVAPSATAVAIGV